MQTEARNTMPKGRPAAPAPAGDPARRARIAIAAYYRAERRGFTPGRELDDWLEAEREVDRGGPSVTAPAPGAAAKGASGAAAAPEAGAKVQAPKPRGGAQRTRR
jgi:hypothetical protein